MKNIPKTFNVRVHYPDLITGNKAIDAPEINVEYNGVRCIIERKLEHSKDSIFDGKSSILFFYLDKKLHEALLKEAKKMIEAYKLETCIDFVSKDIPFDEYKNTKLIKFVLSKL